MKLETTKAGPTPGAWTVECSFCAAFLRAHPGAVRAANPWHAFVSTYTGLAPACSADGGSNAFVADFARSALARAEGKSI